LRGSDVTEATLERARAGDEEAFRALTDPHRRELQLHCYRILGSVQDAEDLVQETMLAAWRGLAGFEGRSSLRSWLYRIATNRCLNALRDDARRPEVVTAGGPAKPEPTRWGEPIWLQPYPDALLEGLPDRADGPDARYETREAVALAFVSGLQRMPPRQRALLVLRDVLGYRAAETAEILDTTVESVTSALKRARASLDADHDLATKRSRPPAPAADSSEERRLVAAFMDAFTRHDVDRLVAILSEDVWLKMPPMPYEYHGREAAITFFQVVLHPDVRTLRMVPTRANGGPANALYALDPATGTYRAIGLFVLGLAGDRICEITRFEPGVLPGFGLPRILS
jgi:RNA polymerase sigma-70 factor (TIGR02960 family)